MRHFSILTALTLTIQLSHAQQYGWQVIARPTTQPLRCVTFVDSLNGWLGGDAIYHTTDGGNGWNSVGVAFLPASISMAGVNLGWAVGNQSSLARIYHTSNGGVGWVDQRSVFGQQHNGTAAKSQLRNTTSSKQASGPDTGLVVQTTNAGTSWTEQTIGDSIGQLGKVQFVDSLHGWITGGYLPAGTVETRPMLVRTVDGGGAWNLVPLPAGLSAFAFIDTLRGWGVARHSTTYPMILRTTDGGMEWDTIAVIIDPGDPTYLAMSFVDSLNGWIFGGTFYQGSSKGVIYRTSDGGFNWVRESIGLSGDIQDGLMVDKHHGWAVALDGRVLAYGPVTSVPERLPDVPTQFALKQNYPNPFNGTTNIEYEVLHHSFLELMVFDAAGRQVMTIVRGLHESGVYRVQLNANALASGVYYLRMESDSFAATKQMLLIK